MNTTPRRAGFTLIEVILIIAVLAILATAAAPAVMQRLLDAKIEQTRTSTKLLYEAMTGNLEQGSYGFVGDIGRLPLTFEELMKPGKLPVYSTTNVRSVGMGWNGPYIHFGTSQADVLKDGFGRGFYTGSGSIGQVRSAGTDGLFVNEDDIVYPPSQPFIIGRVLVTVKKVVGENSTVDPLGYEVRLYYAKEGVQTMLSSKIAPFVFENVPMGLHAIQVLNNTVVVAQDTIASPGSGQTKLVTLSFVEAP